MTDNRHPTPGPDLPAAESGTFGAQPLDLGRVEGGRVLFDNWRGEADRPEAPPPAPLPSAERVGFAVVGLGRLALQQILPAFAACGKARLAGLVSGRPEKAALVARQYGLDPGAVLPYGEIGRLADNPDIRAVYVVTPNGLHRESVLAAARAGKHVLCEKPMANTSDEAVQMVDACKAAGVRLMIAYRCQYEPYNREAIRLVRSGALGTLRLIEATNLQVQGPGAQWRMRGALAGGGALPDIGLYCLNAARAVLGEEPVEVFARAWTPPGDSRYAEVEESIAFMLRFPSGAIANCAAGYGAHETKDLRLRLERGWIDLENAFAYGGQRMRVATRDGQHEAVRELRLHPADQFATEIDHFAGSILSGQPPRTPGEEGVQDHLLMEAIYRSARDGGAVSLAPVPGLDRFRNPG